MTVVETLLGEAKGIFGKAYLLAGILPAGLLLASLSWYLWGLEGIQSRIFTAPVASEAEHAEKGKEGDASEGGATVVAIGAGLILVITALAFFAARGPLLIFCQELPGNIFSPLKRSLHAKQLARLRRLTNKEKRLRWLNSVLVWPSKKFEAYPYIEPWVKPPDLLSATKASEAARAELQRCAPDFDITRKLPGASHIKIIEDGLRALRETTGSASHPAWHYEATLWNRIIEDEKLKQFLEDIANDRYREWAEVTHKINDFPQERWVRPTALGNRFGSIEEYSVSRYGEIDMSTFWSRIVDVLSDSQRKNVDDAELTVGVMLNLAVASAMFGAVVICNIAYNMWRALSATSWKVDLHSMAALPGSVILTIIFYKGAVFAVGALRDKVIRLFDLNHIKLTVALGFEAPNTFGKQRQLLVELNGFFARGEKISDSWTMKPPASEDKSGKNGNSESGSEV